MRKFFIAFLDDLGNLKHFEPSLFFLTFNFYTLQSAIVKQRYPLTLKSTLYRYVVPGKNGKNCVWQGDEMNPHFTEDLPHNCEDYIGIDDHEY